MRDLVKYSALLLVALCSLVALPLITRHFDPTDFGRYSLASGVSTFAYLTVGSGLGSAVQRYFAAPDADHDRTLLSTIWTLTLLLACGTGILALVTGVLIASLLSPAWLPFIPATILALVVVFPATIGIELLRSRRAVALVTFLTTFESLGGLAFGLAIAIRSHQAAGLLWGSAIAGIVVLAGAMSRFRRWHPLAASAPLARDLFYYGLPLSLNNLFGWLLYLSDRYIIAAAHGDHAAGIYAFGYDISYRTITAIGFIISTSAFPLVVHLWEVQGRQAAQVYVTGVLRIMALILAPCVIGLSLLAPTLVDALSSRAYNASAQVIFPVAIGTALYIFSQVHYALLLVRKTALIANFYIFAGFVQVVLNLILIPRFGYLWAGWTTLSSYAMVLLLLWFASNHYLPFTFPWTSWLRIAIATTGMALACIVILSASQQDSPYIRLITVSGVGAGVYFGLLIVLREAPGPRALLRHLSIA